LTAQVAKDPTNRHGDCHRRRRYVGGPYKQTFERGVWPGGHEDFRLSSSTDSLFHGAPGRPPHTRPARPAVVATDRDVHQDGLLPAIGDPIAVQLGVSNELGPMASID
jgi:hypothetical protein